MVISLTPNNCALRCDAPECDTKLELDYDRLMALSYQFGANPRHIITSQWLQDSSFRWRLHRKPHLCPDHNPDDD